MAEAMLDCTLCWTRKWQSFEGPSAEELRLAGATKLPCSICNTSTYWAFSQHDSDRRLFNDRRKEPEMLRTEAMPTAGAREGISLAPPPNKEFYRQEAMKAIQPERRTGADRRACVQRNHHRVPLRLPIRVRVKSFNLQFEEVTNTINVCRTGVFFYSPNPYSKGVRALVTLHYVPNEPGSTMELPGTVVRVDSKPGSDAKGVAIQLN